MTRRQDQPEIPADLVCGFLCFAPDHNRGQELDMSMTVAELMAGLEKTTKVVQRIHADNERVITRQDALEKALDQIRKTPASRAVNPAGVMAGYGGDGAYLTAENANAWPAERIKALSKAYRPELVEGLMRKGHDGRPRGIGIGPALVKMASLCDSSLKSFAPTGYDKEQLEKEYGFVDMHKAATVGVPVYDWVTKTLSNERRKVALAESSGVTGGYVIPPQWMAELLTIAAEDAFIEQRCKVVPMTTRTAEFPMLDITTAQAIGVSPYFGGVQAYWQPEAATINETEPAFKSSTWTAWDLVLYAVSSNQLLWDNGVGLDALLTQLFSQALTWYKEYAFLRGFGAGSSMPMGITNALATIVTARSSPGHFTLADAALMLSKLHVRSWKNSCWIMHQSVLPELIQMDFFTGAGRPVWTTPMGDGKEGMAAMALPTTFFGLPIYFTEKASILGTKGDVMLVDWSQYVIGARMDLQIDVSNQFLFRTNQLAWRVIARLDGKPWLNSYVTDAEGFTSSPFICLNT
jgi:HK97 family phage major capsid protein